MGDRRKRKQATLADLNSNFRSLLPSQVVPREHAECARLVGPKLDKLLDLQSHLKSDTGFVFPDILPREEEQSVNVMPPPLLPPSLPPSLPPPAASTSTMVEQNVEPTIDD